MISPSAGRNTLLQLNMGEGKSSVIVPFSAVSLSHGESLCRIVVLKSLSNQMFELLVERIGGLANRRIFYMPFSRDTKVSVSQVTEMQELYALCVRSGGILVVQPEHILSFKLMALDRLMSGASQDQGLIIANALWESQTWVSKHSRDVLDESDELLHPRYQLIYTIGLQQPFEDHPNRWTTILQLLAIFKECTRQFRSRTSDIFWECTSPSAHPIIRLLTSNVDDELRSLVIERILAGALPNLLFGVLPLQVQGAIAEFIASRDISNEMYEAVKDRCFGSSLWPGVLLLRGLLAKDFGILFYVLKELRWRVDFGLDLTRSMLAVPYRAKVRFLFQI